MVSQADWDALGQAVNDAFGVGGHVTLARANSGGAFSASLGTESGGSTLSAVVKANRVRREVIYRGDGGGGGQKIEVTEYHITLADLATVVSGTWGGGDPRAGDTITEPSDALGGDSKRRVVASVNRLTAVPVVRVVTEAALPRGG